MFITRATNAPRLHGMTTCLTHTALNSRHSDAGRSAHAIRPRAPSAARIPERRLLASSRAAVQVVFMVARYRSVPLARLSPVPGQFDVKAPVRSHGRGPFV
jgi:hypothetical protein